MRKVKGPIRGAWIADGAIVVLSTPLEQKKTRFDALTPAEREVSRLVARGLTNAEIARRRSVSPATIAKHLESVYRKLKVRSRAALANVIE